MRPLPATKILDGLGDEHLRGTGEGANAGADHHAEAGDVIALDRDLAGVQSRPYLDPERTDSAAIAVAQRTPRAGPSNVARNPSPIVLISRPRYRAICERTI